MLNVNQMTMKKVLNITEHKDGTYTLSNLTFEQMHAIQSAFDQNTIRLRALQMLKQAKGHDLNPVAASCLKFAEDASDQLLDMGF